MLNPDYLIKEDLYKIVETVCTFEFYVENGDKFCFLEYEETDGDRDWIILPREAFDRVKIEKWNGTIR